MQSHGESGFYDCFLRGAEHVGRMSLNRSEQLLFDYVQRHRDERQYWFAKVQSIVAGSPELPLAVARLDSELWRYHEERSAVVPDFAAASRALGGKRISMKNLAEHLVRLWTEPKPKKPAPSAENIP
jgi:hypothetical protein